MQTKTPTNPDLQTQMHQAYAFTQLCEKVNISIFGRGVPCLPQELF